jgi:hypothetical protein
VSQCPCASTCVSLVCLCLPESCYTANASTQRKHCVHKLTVYSYARLAHVVPTARLTVSGTASDTAPSIHSCITVDTVATVCSSSRHSYLLPHQSTCKDCVDTIMGLMSNLNSSLYTRQREQQYSYCVCFCSSGQTDHLRLWLPMYLMHNNACMWTL